MTQKSINAIFWHYKDDSKTVPQNDLTASYTLDEKNRFDYMHFFQAI